MSTFRKGVPQYAVTSASGKFQFYSSCINWPGRDVDAGLIPMLSEARDITRGTFLKHVDKRELAELEASLGYEKHYRQGLTMAGDYHVSYHRSKLHGETVYFFKHSAIEYVFKEAA